MAVSSFHYVFVPTLPANRSPSCLQNRGNARVFFSVGFLQVEVLDASGLLFEVIFGRGGTPEGSRIVPLPPKCPGVRFWSDFWWLGVPLGQSLPHRWDTLGATFRNFE